MSFCAVHVIVFPSIKPVQLWVIIKYIYYINTNEIPGELLRENLISSHVKISPLPFFHNKSCLSHQKSYLSEMVLYFIGVYTCIVNRTLHGCLEIQNFSSRVEKYFTRSLRSLVKYFSTLEEKFRIFAWPCNILYVLWVQRVTVVVDTLKVGPRINTLNLPNIWQHIWFLLSSRWSDSFCCNLSDRYTCSNLRTNY